MGKIKRARQNYHITAPKSNSTKPFDDSSAFTLSLPDPNFKIDITSQGSKNIFKNTEIPASIFDNKYDGKKDFDVRSVYSSRSIKSQTKGLPKKEKRLLKRELFLKKLEACREADKKLLEQKKRKATPIVKDMQPLYDALPTLNELIKNSEKKEHVQKPRLERSLKRQKKEMEKDISTFHLVLNDPLYKSDPFGAISTHVKLLLEAQRK